MAEYLIRFAQLHETFRLPEIQALATLAGVDLEIVSYDRFSPYCIVRLENDAAARAVISRSILARDIHELWGQGASYQEVHADVRSRTQHRWADYKDVSFRFSVDCFAGKRSQTSKRDIINSFSYLDFQGPIVMRDPDEQFGVMEEYISDVETVSSSASLDAEVAVSLDSKPSSSEPKRIYLARWVASSSREMITKYDLKKRRYISTTSMDAELALVTANMALAAPGKLFYDPFVGTGSFSVAAAHFGSIAFGSDIDGRSFRGKDTQKGTPIGVVRNFLQYGLMNRFGDVFTADLTNTPLRTRQFLDGIICDPPYGVREGLRVLGLRDGHARAKEKVLIDGVPAHTLPGYIAPKKPYGFEAMLNDILEFAAQTLVTYGRLAMWMPTASDEEGELEVPMHPTLEVISVCVQPFNNWSRRLITYQRLPEGQTSDVSMRRQKMDAQGMYANELNAFRRKYFTKNKGANLTGSSSSSVSDP